ncbi:right-handed parallel beta-helix repeat-containing protein [Bradyrhizobium guangdongense]|uniref:right-handed parallel beta-helix repeat-containing protein n=1 Tax=Bradyrhizobium guangdongense TaxID=1325090 RepID=UPI00131A0933|nr:right-handed parallel beta-helix repeat-containing protein [Bradyrhizobium guangdongense]
MKPSITRRAVSETIAATLLSGFMPRPLAAGDERREPSTPVRDWPNDRTTGVQAGTELALHSGNMTIDTPNAVIRGLDIRGTVIVKAAGVTIEQCRVTAVNPWDWFVILTLNDTVVRNCTIDGGNVNSGQNAINGSGTFIDNNIFNTENGIAPGSNTTIEGNYIHDLRAPGSAHYDGIQMDGNQSDVVIRRNTIINSWPQTSAVMINNWAGPVSNVLIEDNLLLGGSYTIYVDGRFNKNPISGVIIRGNHLGGGRYGHLYRSNSVPLLANNSLDGLAVMQSIGLLR